MKRDTKAVIGMYARRAIKLFIKTNLALLSSLKKSSQRDHNINNVYMLMYHRVNDYRKNEMSVSVQEFRKQVAWLKRTGFRNMRMAELESATPGLNLNAPKVIFSFDDGYMDNFSEALPILKEFGYTAIFYIPYEFIGKKDMFPRDIRESNRAEHNRIMGWEQVTSLLREGMEIGSHTLSHNNLKEMNDAQAKREIVESKKYIEEKLGEKITSFCYPGGQFNEKHTNWVERAGYSSACTTASGVYREESLFTIPRVAVLASDSFFIFKRKMLGDLSLFRMVH